MAEKIYVFALDGVQPAECSYQAATPLDARKALQAELESVPGVMDALVSVEMVDELGLQDGDVTRKPLGFADMRALILAWKADGSYDLYGLPEYHQHDAFLREFQKSTEEAWEGVREAALKDRADKAGVSPEVMRLIEAQRAQIERLERALNALVDAGSFEKGTLDCYNALRS